jgi:hypothetical protein
VVPYTCFDFTEYCSNCADCLAVIGFSQKNGEIEMAPIYYWVANDPIDTERNSPGKCVERWTGGTDRTTGEYSGEERQVGSEDLCGKRVFLECSHSSTKSVVVSCPLSAGSAMKGSTVTASLVAAFTVYLIFN